MKYLNFKSNYNKNPIIKISDEKKLMVGVNEIVTELKKIKKGVIAFETYPGVNLDILKEEILIKLNPNLLINVEEFAKTEEELNEMLSYNLTDDRVFGVYSHHKINDFYHQKDIININNIIKNQELVILYGFGSSLFNYDYINHVSITRWEIQLRFRQGYPNFRSSNYDEDNLRKYKRGFFIEWRVADRIKDKIKDEMSYVIDYNDLSKPVMIDKKTYLNSLNEVTKRPFRMVPYFDPGVWGGQWMKEVCNLDPNKENYAWSFDGVPEENSIKLGFGKDTIELPTQDVVQFYPKDLMGDKVHARFGKMYPIRFDLLDTMQGGNLSLQVHPLQEYIFDNFGMTYTQDESYYILDNEDDAVCYLGFKENVNKDQFIKELSDSAKGLKSFDADKFIHKFNVKKHDHYSIPAGTIHCSGTNTMVLEISACNYIFTFKLWDWDRLGLDGRPRPVHLEHGLKNLDYTRTKTWVNENLINPFVKINDHEEVTGLHERQFLKTTRYTFNKPLLIKTNNTVTTANLVEGISAIIKSPTNSFKPFTVNYAETFIIPANIDSYTIETINNKEGMIITAQVK